MVSRKKKKGRKMRGSRTRGTGHSKKHRGAGHKGGHGRAGSKKHAVMRTRKQGRKIGRRKFRAPNPITHETINVGRVSEIMEEAGLKKMDLSEKGYDKLLGSGKVRGAYEISVSLASAKAKEKIEQAGGEVKTK